MSRLLFDLFGKNVKKRSEKDRRKHYQIPWINLGTDPVYRYIDYK